MSDQDRISPYNINMILSWQVMGKEKMSIRGLLVDPKLNFLTDIIGIVWNTLKRIS